MKLAKGGDPLSFGWGYRIIRGVIGFLFRTLTRLEVKGLELVPDHGPYLLVVNHLHWLDSPLLMVAMPHPVRVFAGEKWGKHWFIGPMMRLVNAIFVNRGEVDRRALPAPEASRAALGTGTYVGPRSPIEEMLAGFFREMLGLPAVGIHDNFFELGGNSLLLVRAHERLRPLFGARPPSVVELFEYSTVASLAERLRSDGPGSTDDARGAREERARQGRDRLEQRRRRRQEVVASGEDEGGA